MNSDETFRKALHDHQLSATKPRIAVFTALKHHKSLTMSQLVKACPSVDRASVYRVVAAFEKIGVIVRIPSGWKYLLELGEAFNEHHHHATCLVCGGSIALPEDAELESRLHAMALRRNFKITSHQIELSGMCEACQQATDNS